MVTSANKGSARVAVKALKKVGRSKDYSAQVRIWFGSSVAANNYKTHSTCFSLLFLYFDSCWLAVSINERPLRFFLFFFWLAAVVVEGIGFAAKRSSCEERVNCHVSRG